MPEKLKAVTGSDTNINSLWGEELFKAPESYRAQDYDRAGIKSVFFDGIPYRGKQTRVFAYIGLPEECKGTKVPGVVLVHGGGGTALSEWVEIWNKRGYAAIAIDHEGHIPVKNETETSDMHYWLRHEWGGPFWLEMLNNNDMLFKDQWLYHAVADAILANSLLRSMNEVDEKRIGITGISLGGIVTCLASSVDQRFCFAIPVYGCGYLKDSKGNAGIWFREKITEYKDPADFLGRSKVPMLWINSDHDPFFSIDCFAKSFRLTKAQSGLTIHPDLEHCHEAGWASKEIYDFADSIVKDGLPLSRIINQGYVPENSNLVFVEYNSVVPVKKVELIYSVIEIDYDRENWNYKGQWITTGLELNMQDNMLRVQLPAGMRLCYINITDERNLVVSSDLIRARENNDVTKNMKRGE